MYIFIAAPFSVFFTIIYSGSYDDYLMDKYKFNMTLRMAIAGAAGVDETRVHVSSIFRSKL